MPKPWYADGLRFSCSQCGECCRTHGEYAYVYLSNDDITRLSEHLQIERNAFLQAYTDRDGPWRILRWPEEACVFLTEKGCSVYEARPTQCRTWPFWEENLDREVWFNEIVPFCPGAGEGRLYDLREIRACARGESEAD